MAWLVCRYIFVFVGLSFISVNLSVLRDSSVDIYRQPYGRKMCESLCQSISGCSNFEYSYASLSCRVTSGPTSTCSDDVGRRATSEGLQPMRKSCPQHSRILTTRKGHNVCVRDKNVHRFQMTEPRVYYLGDYAIEVIERTSLLMRLNASGKVEVTFWDGGRYGRKVTIGQNNTVLIHEVFKPNHTSQVVHSVNLTEPFWKVCVFTELWFRWNNAGFLSLGKGWIPGSNLVIQYQDEAKLSFSSVTLKRTGTFRTEKRKHYTEVITVEVKRDGHISTIGKCNNDKTRVILNMTTSGVFYYLSDYGFPTIGRNSVVMTFDFTQDILIRFSQEYNPVEDERMVSIKCYPQKQVETYTAGISFCVGPFVYDFACTRNLKRIGDLYNRNNYDDNAKLIIWLEWDHTGYLSIGTGMTPGVNRSVEYWGNSTLLVNYITMKYQQLNTSVVATITACNKHTNIEKAKRVQVKR